MMDEDEFKEKAARVGTCITVSIGLLAVAWLVVVGLIWITRWML